MNKISLTTGREVFIRSVEGGDNAH
uniref:Uncharacterized protein n=1 Tax=Rhizophora mucronata TaxID=61149 RepID=A0A2P2JTH1_RHIMU